MVKGFSTLMKIKCVPFVDISCCDVLNDVIDKYNDQNTLEWRPMKNI